MIFIDSIDLYEHAGYRQIRPFRGGGKTYLVIANTVLTDPRSTESILAALCTVADEQRMQSYSPHGL